MSGIGLKEIIALAIIFVLFFWSKKIPDLARGIGKTLKYMHDAFISVEKG